MRRFNAILFVLAFAFALASVRGAETLVEIRDYFFSPSTVTIAPGDTVRWVNKGFVPHDTTSLNGLWASGLLYNDEEFFTYTFTQAGQYPYVCATHIADYPGQTGLVIVASANLPPSVSITNPASGAVFTAPASFTIAALANDSDGTVGTVQFFVNGTPVGSSSGPTFSAAVSGLSAGSYSLTAVATDNQGATTTSDAVNIIVEASTPVKYPLTVSVAPPNSGSVTANPSQPADGYDAGTTVMLTASAATGFAFTGWNGAVTGTQNPLAITMDAAKSITANFAPNTTPTHVLTLITNPPAAGTIQASPAPNGASGTYLEGTRVTLTASPALNFAFTNWTGDASSPSNSIEIVMDADKTLTANFFAAATPAFSLTLITNPAGAGRIQSSPLPNAPNGQYYEGTVVTLTASPSGQNVFRDWTGDTNSTAASIVFAMNSDKTFTANFVPPPAYALVLTVSPTNFGSVFVTPAPDSNGTYSAGTTVGLAALPSSGFRFVGWTGAVVSTNNPILIVMNGNRALTALFEAIPPIDYNEAAGVYSGLLLDEQKTNYTTSGFITVRVSKTGRYRGTATIGGMRELIAGQFDRLGYAPMVARGASLNGSLRIDNGGQRIFGTLIEGTNSPARSPALLLNRAANPANAEARTGRYAITFGAAEPVSTEGMATLEISLRGLVRLRGTLGDGTLVTERTFISPDGRIPLFVQLYGRRGVIIGWLDVMDGTVQGVVRWFRPGDSRRIEFADGFAIGVAVTGSRID